MSIMPKLVLPIITNVPRDQPWYPKRPTLPNMPLKFSKLPFSYSKIETSMFRENIDGEKDIVSIYTYIYTLFVVILLLVIT